MSPECLDAVASALGDAGARPLEIHKRVDGYSIVTVRHALRELVATGRATYEGADCIRKYRRAANKASIQGDEK